MPILWWRNKKEEIEEEEPPYYEQIRETKAILFISLIMLAIVGAFTIGLWIGGHTNG